MFYFHVLVVAGPLVQPSHCSLAKSSEFEMGVSEISKSVLEFAEIRTINWAGFAVDPSNVCDSQTSQPSLPHWQLVTPSPPAVMNATTHPPSAIALPPALVASHPSPASTAHPHLWSTTHPLCSILMDLPLRGHDLGEDSYLSRLLWLRASMTLHLTLRAYSLHYHHTCCALSTVSRPSASYRDLQVFDLTIQRLAEVFAVTGYSQRHSSQHWRFILTMKFHDIPVQPM